MLPRLIGYARAMALTLLGEPVHAKDAAEMGMIWKMIPDAEFDAYIDDLHSDWLNSRLCAGFN